MTRFDLDDHLRNEHRRTPFSEYLREIVYGGNDGIVTTFAVVAGFAGAQKDMTAAVPVISVLLFGLANLFADGLSMGLGSFLSLRAEKDVYRNEKAKEHHEIIHDPDNEFAETVEILERKKFSKNDATQIATLYRKNPDYWTEFMMKDELEMPSPEKENALFVAISTFLSFTAFGFIPLLPYIANIKIDTVFTTSIIFTGLALFLLGLLRAIVSNQKPLRGILETVIIGSVSASAAFFVGTFFRV